MAQSILVKNKEIRVKNTQIVVEDEQRAELIEFTIYSANSIEGVMDMAFYVQYRNKLGEVGMDLLTNAYPIEKVHNDLLVLDWLPSSAFSKEKGNVEIQIVGFTESLEETEDTVYSVGKLYFTEDGEFIPVYPATSEHSPKVGDTIVGTVYENKITANDHKWSTEKVNLTLPENIYDNGTPIYTEEQVKSLITQIQAEISVAGTNALKSEGFAVGEQNRTEVDSDSPYYHNNAKYYNEQAGISSGSASGSASDAYAYKLDAENARDKAEEWATKTNGKIDNIDYSAKQYALNAKASADIVEEHATAINSIYADLTNIDAVANDIQDEDSIINTVAENIQDVNAVVESINDVNDVADDLNDSDSNIKTVAANITDVGTVATNISNVNDVADNETNINTVAGDKTNIDAVAGNKSNIDTVAGISSAVSTVADADNDISTVATNISDVSAVADNISNVNAVADNETNINAVNSNKTNIDTVAGSISDVSTVSSDIANVGAVADDLTKIDAVADDLTNIDNAITNASLSRQYAEGKKLDGTDVVSGEAGYQDNAKYYAQQASSTLSSKADKDTDAVIGNMAKFDASGNPIDAGFSALNTLKAIKITAQGTTLADIAAILNTVNGSGDHVVFDVSALGAGAYLCTIFMDGYPDATQSTVYKLFDLVTGKYAEGHYDGTTLLTMVLAISDTVATQGQIDYLQKEIDKIGGLNLITDYEALGKAIADGTSTDSISIGDTIEINWIKTVTGITTTAGNSVTCNDKNAFITQLGECEAKSYLFVFDGTNWTYNAEAITLSQWGLVVSGTPVAGEVMTITTTVTPVSYTFTSYDTVEPVSGNVAHNWLLEQTYAPSTKGYSTYESLFCVQAGKTIPAGKYYIPMYSYRSSKTFNACFTLSADMGSSTKIQAKSNGYSSGTIKDKDGNSVSGVYYPSSLTPIVYQTGTNAGSNFSLSFLSDAEASSGGYTNLKSLNEDVDDPVVVVGSFDKSTFGNNCWADSNIRQWLNDDTLEDNFVPTNDNNIASSYNRGAGFLYGIDPRAKALIQTAKVKWTAGRDNKNWTYNTTYIAEDKVFMLSMKEMSFDINTSEGLMTQLYGYYTNNTLTNGNVAARAKYNKAGGTLNSYRWSRSAYVYVAIISRLVSSSGGYDDSNACNAVFFAPAFIFGKESA